MPVLRKRVCPVCVHTMRCINRTAIPHTHPRRYLKDSDVMNALPRHRLGFYSFVGIALVAAVILTIF